MKKNTHGFFALCFLLWTACAGSPSEEIPEPLLSYPVQFRVRMEKEIFPFPGMRSMPSMDLPEPGGEEEKELVDFCSRMDYLVYTEGKNGAPFKHLQLKEGVDPDFGIVYDTLPAGNYKVCFLTHNAKEVALADGHLAFGEVTDAFHQVHAVTVDAAGLIIEDITLERIVSRIEFCAVDPVPDGADRLEMEVEHLVPSVNPFTGEGVPSTQTTVFSYIFGPDDIGKEHFIHSFFTFIPHDGTPLLVRITTYAHDGTVLRQREVKPVVPLRNKIIRYTGKLYGEASSDETFRVSVSGNGAWGGVDDNELPD